MNKDKADKKVRTPGRKLTREELARVIGGDEIINGCCTQGCCCSLDPSPVIGPGGGSTS